MCSEFREGFEQLQFSGLKRVREALHRAWKAPNDRADYRQSRSSSVPQGLSFPSPKLVRADVEGLTFKPPASSASLLRGDISRTPNAPSAG
jgi:hypothetical protein